MQISKKYHFNYVSGAPFDRMNYLKYVKVWHQKKHHLTDAVDMSNLSSEDSDNDDSGFFHELTIEDIDNVFYSDTILY